MYNQPSPNNMQDALKETEHIDFLKSISVYDLITDQQNVLKEKSPEKRAEALAILMTAILSMTEGFNHNSPKTARFITALTTLDQSTYFKMKMLTTILEVNS